MPPTQTITVNGVPRHYSIYRPTDAHGPRPLIIFLHGSGASAAQPASELGLVPQADAAGVVVVYPDGEPPTFSWASGCCQARANSHADLDFITALVHRLEADGIADPRHVVISGFSSGAITAYALGCDDPKLFRAVVAVSGAMLAPPPFVRASAPSAKCAPSQPVSVYQIHGTNDTTDPTDGSTQLCAPDGPCGPGVPRWEPSAATVDSWWRQLDHCGTPTTRLFSGHSATVADCAAGTQVGIAQVDGGTHDLGVLAHGFPISDTLVNLALGRSPQW
jgi:polyhydroxybutyrate depolymerase